MLFIVCFQWVACIYYQFVLSLYVTYMFSLYCCSNGQALADARPFGRTGLLLFENVEACCSKESELF